jgi:hypothetical protein
MADVKPPRGTGAAGKAVWSSVVGDFALERFELQILGQAATVADRIGELDALVDSDGVLVDGKAHPALIESRLQRLTLARLLAALRLPDHSGARPQHRTGFRGTHPGTLLQAVGDGGS